MAKFSESYLISRFVILCSLLSAVALGIALWNINPWPTDAEVYYMPAAWRIPSLHFLSEIHSGFDMENVRWLHGKEFYVAAIALFEFFLNDFETLRPLMVLGIVAIMVSGILIFYIARRFWDERIALFCYLAFAFCVWPYVYILFAKHQTLGLMFFLASIAVLFNMNKTRFRFVWPFLSGVSLGLSCFASTVSSLYVPYYGAAFLYIMLSLEKDSEKLKTMIGRGLLVFTGFLLMFFYVNLPDIFYNIDSFAKYIVISGAKNHFYYNQVHLQQWFPNIAVSEVRGGWEWIFKYFFLIMPILFPLYLLAIAYLIFRISQENSGIVQLKIAGFIIISFAPPIMAELAKVAQYGSNYFPMLVGVIMIVGYAAYDLKKHIRSPSLRLQLRRFLIGVIAIHCVINLYVFVSDVYACRMVTTFLGDKIKELKIERMWTYQVHPHRNNFVYSLNTELRKKMGWLPMKYLIQAEKGYILVPPAAGDSLYIASKSSYANFDKDIFLVQLIRKGLLKDTAVASFPTLANSRIWRQEEEILSYRDLVLGQHFPVDELGRVWLLDAQKVQEHKKELLPRPDDMPLVKDETKNIGTAEKFYIFQGQHIAVPANKPLRRVITQMWKIGNPKDTLIGSLYRIDGAMPTWLPVGKHFTTQPLAASSLPANQARGVTAFTFDPPLDLNEGVYFFVVYRSGQPDDQNFYQIDNKHFGVQ